MSKKIRINMSNKLFYLLLIVGMTTLSIIAVTAYNSDVNPSVMGHSINEIAPPAGCTSGQVLSWTGTTWKCINPAVAPTPAPALAWLGGKQAHTKDACTVAGGVIVYDGAVPFCKFSGAIIGFPNPTQPVWNSILGLSGVSCLSGWKQYKSWSARENFPVVKIVNIDQYELGTCRITNNHITGTGLTKPWSNAPSPNTCTYYTTTWNRVINTRNGAQQKTLQLAFSQIGCY